MHHHRRLTVSLLRLLVASLALGGGASAAATGKGRWVAGIAPSYAYVVMQDRSEPDGGGASLHVSYGVTEAFSVRFFGLWSGHSVGDREDEEGNVQEGGLLQVVSLTVGGSYAFDLLRVSPSLEAGIGVLYERFAGESTTNLGVIFGLGLDYWLRDWISIGVAFHYHAFVTNLAQYPVYFDAGPRVSVRWP